MIDPDGTDMIDLSIYMLDRWYYARTSAGSLSLVISYPQLDFHPSNIALIPIEDPMRFTGP